MVTVLWLLVATKELDPIKKTSAAARVFLSVQGSHALGTLTAVRKELSDSACNKFGRKFCLGSPPSNSPLSEAIQNKDEGMFILRGENPSKNLLNFNSPTLPKQSFVSVPPLEICQI